MSERERLDWIDTGRGIAIFLVALFHATNWLNDAGVQVPYWTAINETVSTLRMPLFFVLSGLFAGKWLTAPWRSLWNTKLSLFVWVFLVWEVIGSAVFQLGLAMKGQCCGIRSTIVDLLVSPALPRFELWFIWALALFFVAAKLLRKVDWRVQLAAAGVVSAVALGGWTTASVGWSGSAKYFFFFLVGIYGRHLVLRLGGIRSVLALAGIVLCWAAISVVLAFFALRDIPGLYFVNCLAGVAGGVALSRLLSRVTWLRQIGTQTLPIYLTHTPIVIILSFVISIQPILGAANAVAPVVPVLVAATAVVLSRVIHASTHGRAARYLYEQPSLMRAASPISMAPPAPGSGQ